jgi:hypothetical protein
MHLLEPFLRFEQSLPNLESPYLIILVPNHTQLLILLL